MEHAPALLSQERRVDLGANLIFFGRASWFGNNSFSSVCQIYYYCPKLLKMRLVIFTVLGLDWSRIASPL
jgi:hypothetical protein